MVRKVLKRAVTMAPARTIRSVSRNVVTARTPILDRGATSAQDVGRYVEYTSKGVEAVEDGPGPILFGEFLIENGFISRYQLFRAMQLQDRHPAVKIGECVAALGFMQITEVESAFASFMKLPTVQAA